MSDIVIGVIKFILCVILGGWFIKNAIKCYRANALSLFGAYTILTIFEIFLLFKLVIFGT